MLPVPPHFDPKRVAEVWRVPYEERASNATAWARAHGLRPAADDARRIALLLVDMQNTFCMSEFELFVPGAPDDSRRICEFVYRNLDAITQIVLTLDTHQAMQIFHALWLVDDGGRHPAPYTLVSAEDVERGVWCFNPNAGLALGIDPEAGQRHLLEYTRALARSGKYALTVWPYHAMLGGVGHAIVSAVEEAVFFHTVARQSQARFEAKGRVPWTEHYSALGPEVTVGPSGESVPRRNDELVTHLLSFDAVVIAGEAKSHCVAWTIDDLLAEPALAEKTYLLEDCTSPVVVAGAVDYTDEANAAFERFAAAGMHVVRSTEPLEEWLRR
ncbi:MAG: isochorismatase [Gaiellaceae bacterium]